MRILLDTNILFSGFVYDGNEKDLIEKIIASTYTIVVTDLILEEIERLFEKKLSKSEAAKSKIIFNNLQKSGFVRIKSRSEYQKLLSRARALINAKDAPILAAGLQDEINLIVSGDADFITNPKISFLRKKKIFTTKEALDVL